MAEVSGFRGRIYDSITECIGQTPLIRIRRLTAGLPGTVVAKMENFNPLWSVKDAHNGWIHGLTLNADGTKIATCGRDQTVRI